MPQTRPLNSSELADAHEIVGLSDYTVSDISDLAALLSDETLDLIRGDISLWADKVREKDLKVKGGRDGIDLDPERFGRRIRARLCKKLGIEVPSSGGLFNISVGGRA